MGLIRLMALNWDDFKSDIDKIEAEATYSLGHDFFRIDHGLNYFSFFERLGQVYYYGWQKDGKIVAVAAGVLRNIVGNSSKECAFNAWYLCDLKVHITYRGQNIPFQLLAAAFSDPYIQCARGYTISMDTLGITNRTATLLRRFRYLRFNAVEKLFNWSLNKQKTDQALPLIQKHHGTVSFLSLQGIKDLILKSTNKPLPLFHVQFGPMGRMGLITTYSDATYMR